MALGASLVGVGAGCATDGEREPAGPTATPSPGTQTTAPTETDTPVEFRTAKDAVDMSTDTGGEGYTATGTVTLAEQRYAHLELAPPTRFHVAGVVESRGPPTDFIGMRHPELERYQHGEDFESVPAITELGTTRTTFDAELPAATYRLVFDNTPMGSAPPASEVVIDFEWSVRPA